MTPKAWKRLFARTVLWTGLSLGALLLGFLALATWRISVKEREARTEHLNEVQALADLSARKEALSQDLKNLDSERGVEAEVRKRYPVAKPGEEEIMLINPKSNANATTSTSLHWWDKFFGWLPW